MKLKYFLRNLKNISQHGFSAPIAEERIYINTELVENIFTRGNFISRELTGSVIDGDWDLKTTQLKQHPKFIICHNHFVDGLSWEKSGAYALMKQLLDKNSKGDGCSTWSQVLEQYKKLDILFSELTKTGHFKTRQEITGKRTSKKRGGIYIHIDRNGAPIFGGGGHHRLAIAKILGIKQIPAQI